MEEPKRRANERKFGNWIELPGGGRRYRYDVINRGRRARYVKEVDHEERTTRFAQDIYEPGGRLVEIHEKFPVDLGHRKVD
jgi:hypothetical protein